MSDRKRLMAELEEVEARLHKGWDVCEAESDPAKLERYERVWLELLKQYEDLFKTVHGISGSQRGSAR